MSFFFEEKYSMDCNNILPRYKSVSNETWMKKIRFICSNFVKHASHFSSPILAERRLVSEQQFKDTIDYQRQPPRQNNFSGGGWPAKDIRAIESAPIWADRLFCQVLLPTSPLIFGNATLQVEPIRLEKPAAHFRPDNAVIDKLCGWTPRWGSIIEVAEILLLAIEILLVSSFFFATFISKQFFIYIQFRDLIFELMPRMIVYLYWT